uniref:C2H2-type domain-containing protein n=1 Tax=Esox lucius TaxID=8010 RepID=A0A3P9AA15_ESOLU
MSPAQPHQLSETKRPTRTHIRKYKRIQLFYIALTIRPMFLDMSFEVFFRSRVVSIMETLTAKALQDICQLMEETCVALREEIKHEQNQSNSRTNLKLQENGTWTEKPATCVANVEKTASPPCVRNFPVVEQILNEQEANGLWLDGDHSLEDEVPSSVILDREGQSQPLGQTTDQVIETWQAPLVIKQEEMDENDVEFQGYGEWMPGTNGANQNNPGESDEPDKSQSFGGSGKLKDLKRQHSPCRGSTGDAVAPKRKSHSSYTCEICGKIETQKHKLASHMITHTGMPYGCDVCGEKFMLLKFLIRHKQSKHTVKTYKCSLCEKTFLKAGFRDNHERSHSGKNYRCSDCGETFKERGDRDAHKCIVFTGKQLFSCSECSENFDRQYHLKRHQMDQHPFMMHQAHNPEPKSKDIQDQQAKQQSVGETIEKPYSCSVCPMVFVYRKSRENHERKHIQQDYCCSDCGKTFKELQQRKAHKCKGEQSFRCSVCGKDFEKQYILKRHQLEKHPPRVDQTVIPEPARQHFRQNTGKSYSCTVCGKGFIYIKSLNKHELTHWEVKVHRDPDTTMSLVQMANSQQLKSIDIEGQHRHFEVAEASEEPVKSKPTQYTSEVCGETCWNEGGMSKHMSIHTKRRFVCNVCGKVFRRQRALNMHQLVHKTCTQIRCLQCNQDFTSLYDLKKHQLEKNHVMEEQPPSDQNYAASVPGTQASVGSDQSTDMSDRGGQ